MNKHLRLVQTGLTLAGATLATMLGGFDSSLRLLFTLICVDMLTGVLYAITKKRLSSNKLRSGIIRKVVTFFVIFVAVQVDICIRDIGGGTPTLWGVTLSIRTFTVIWFCLEESISLLENLANLGVPFPKWLKVVLLQVSTGIGESTPRELLDGLAKFLPISDTDKARGKDTKANSTDDTVTNDINIGSNDSKDN